MQKTEVYFIYFPKSIKQYLAMLTTASKFKNFSPYNNSIIDYIWSLPLHHNCCHMAVWGNDLEKSFISRTTKML